MPQTAPSCRFRENWALIFELQDEVIDRDHPDFDFWAEQSHLLELVEGGEAPPADETQAKLLNR
jgi:hypothetical protein